MSVAIPMVNAPYLDIQGMELSWVSTTVIDVFDGQCRDSSNTNDISIASNVTVTTTVKGAGGIDTGSVAASTLYYVFAIGSSLGQEDGAGLYSLSPTSPVLPLGYDMFRRVGAVLTDGSSHFLKFEQTGESTTRRMWYDAGIVIINGGTSATFADVDMTGSMPALGTSVVLNATLTPTGNGDTVTVQPKGATDAAGYIVLGGSQAGVALHNAITVPCAGGLCSYKVTGTVTLALRAYDDNLI